MRSPREAEELRGATPIARREEWRVLVRQNLTPIPAITLWEVKSTSVLPLPSE
jgi:hypothetical protein